MTASKIFLYFCLSFVFGIFLSSFFNFSQLILLGFLILGLILISVFWRYRNFTVVGFCILFLVLGIWRNMAVELRILNSELRKLNDLEEKITLMGIVSAEPDLREKSQKLTVEIKSAEFVTPMIGREKVLVTTNRYPEYKYGDKLKIIGKYFFSLFRSKSFKFRNAITIIHHLYPLSASISAASSRSSGNT